MATDLAQFYLSQTEPNKSCFLALQAIILQSGEGITETIKYGMPCFCVGRKPVCYLWTDKKTGHPYVLLVEGKRISHPALEAGDRSRMKIFRVDPEKDIPVKTLKTILKMTLNEV